MSYNLPCVLMRGGTSRGPFFLADWLPQDPAARDRTLIAALGSPHELQIDGLGGGNSLTSKVAIVSRSVHADCDVDYLFAQVSVEEARVDTRPNCGNMLAGVGPFAIEQGLVPASAHGNTTTVRVYNVNTHSRIDVQVCTAGGSVHYDGDMHIDGVQGTAAPVLMNFLDAWGAVTGQIFPTGQRIDTIYGLQVTCIDAAQVMVLVRAEDLGLRGNESPAELDANADLLSRLEALRCEAGLRMGHGRCVQQRAAQARDRVGGRSTGQRRVTLFHPSAVPPFTRRDGRYWRGCRPCAAGHGHFRRHSMRDGGHAPRGGVAPGWPHSCGCATYPSGRPI